MANAQNSVDYYRSLFLLKFLKYANWPNPPNTYTIGVVGNSPIIPHLKTITKDKEINGKYVILRKVSSYENIENFSLLYVPKSQNNKLEYIVSLTQNMSVLIVSEDDKFIFKGASISFYEENNALKFKINTTTIDKQKIQLSTRLISVGLIIR
jgi:hypothetical protein